MRSNKTTLTPNSSSNFLHQPSTKTNTKMKSQTVEAFTDFLTAVQGLVNTIAEDILKNPSFGRDINDRAEHLKEQLDEEDEFIKRPTPKPNTTEPLTVPDLNEALTRIRNMVENGDAEDARNGLIYLLREPVNDLGAANCNWLIKAKEEIESGSLDKAEQSLSNVGFSAPPPAPEPPRVPFYSETKQDEDWKNDVAKQLNLVREVGIEMEAPVLPSDDRAKMNALMSIVERVARFENIYTSEVIALGDFRNDANKTA